MEQVKELVLEIAAVLVFCIAITLFLYITKQFDTQINYVKTQLYNQHAIYPYQ